MRHDLQINRLRALVAVVEHGGFRRAAEALHITQPAVSQQIRQLAGFIKGPVFASTGRDMRLSPQGEELLRYARRIVALNDEAVARFVPEAGQALLSVGVASQLAEVLPEFLRLVNRSLPHVQLRVRTGASEALEQQCRTGQLDAALLLQAGELEPGTDRRELGRMRTAWFGRPPTTGAVLPVALFPDPCTVRAHVGEALDRAGIAWQIAYEGPELIGLRSAAKAGLGVTCLVANGDELWGLPLTVRPGLPQPPTLPVTLALAHGAVPEEFPRVAERAFRRALEGYPLITEGAEAPAVPRTPGPGVPVPV
ncbi:putative transcriptional regulator, LysR family protein [Streptomyces spiroverticillatus]|uniref:Transcriptional regulator, LysR family protein n=1 Tax=Streptomyces finlayi TaxID=67296 RepID=A0A918X536_9ACTN|nr:LysR family transcriptional regulator [Streptomyces finlayi]GHA31875.1 putative transcriptional regulator, LysR family protein [Streptomyces spiroverticillatus]GHD10852.1 putative transcriptional regulator, LysR family protein [Streptomyces finlayi]